MRSVEWNNKNNLTEHQQNQQEDEMSGEGLKSEVDGWREILQTY